MQRTLRLQREPLCELTTDELAGVTGGTAATLTCQLWQKLSDRLDCHSWQCTR